jgi:hypothetical protein
MRYVSPEIALRHQRHAGSAATVPNLASGKLCHAFQGLQTSLSETLFVQLEMRTGAKATWRSGKSRSRAFAIEFGGRVRLLRVVVQRWRDASRMH